MITVLVDDLRSFADRREAIVCRTVNDAFKVLLRFSMSESSGAYDIDELWLDHDMGETLDGGDVVKVLCQYAENSPGLLTIGKIYVHTSNPPAGERMVAHLQDAGYNAERFWEGWDGNMWMYVPSWLNEETP